MFRDHSGDALINKHVNEISSAFVVQKLASHLALTLPLSDLNITLIFKVYAPTSFVPIGGGVCETREMITTRPRVVYKRGTRK